MSHEEESYFPNLGIAQTRRSWRVDDVKREFAAGWTGQLFVFRGQKCRRIRSAFQKLLVASERERNRRRQCLSGFYINWTFISLLIIRFSLDCKVSAGYLLLLANLYCI